MSNQTTKGWPRLAVCVAACFLIMSTLAQFSFPQPVPQPDVHVSNVTTVNVEMPSKFSLWEGAYVSWKVKNADEDIRAKYAKKVGGMNEYRFEMRREAEGMWKLAQKR